MADEKANVLVLGGSGQVGGAMLREARRRGLQAVGTYGRHAQPGLQRWDAATSAAPLLERLRPSVVVYAIGLTNVDACEAQEDEAMRWNALLPASIARSGRGRFQFVYFSTDYVFDGMTGPYAETDEVRPLSAYGRSKARGEAVVMGANASAVVVRTTVVYGPEAQGKNFVAQLRARLAAGERLRAAGDQMSTPTYNEDLARAALDLVGRQAAGVWHVAGPELMSRADFARLSARIFRFDEGLVEALTTEELHQTAPRPLRAGLRTDKLLAAALPHAMRSPREGLEAYAAEEAPAIP